MNVADTGNAIINDFPTGYEFLKDRFVGGLIKLDISELRYDPVDCEEIDELKKKYFFTDKQKQYYRLPYKTIERSKSKQITYRKILFNNKRLNGKTYFKN